MTTQCNKHLFAFQAQNRRDGVPHLTAAQSLPTAGHCCCERPNVDEARCKELQP